MHTYAADGSQSHGDEECKRAAGRKHQSLSPGLFAVFCHHGLCLGFQLLRDPESERVPFEIFYSRLDSCTLFRELLAS